MKTRTISPGLLVSVLLAVAALGFFVYQWVAAGQQVAADRAKLLEHIAIELDKETVDASELSRLVQRVKELPDHATAPDLLAAQARIELFRGRPERAYEFFVPVASRPGALPEHMSLAAEVLLRYHQAGIAARGDAVLCLEQALAFADQAHAYTNDVKDLVRAWLAAMRLTDKERTDEFAARIEAEHQQSAAHRLVTLWREFSLSTDQNKLELVRAEFDDPPAELEAMLAVLILNSGDVPAAVAHMEGLLSRAPGIVEVRWIAAVVFQACVEGNAAGSAERRPWVVRRNAQLDWLIAQGAPNDPRRENWAAMRSGQ